ncbi:hypothetical protein [Glycocaulis sp.]|uniref:hypothetical protein n=1 Tax=Glycocaulis sp. TaxID=1969725 RepID=UPI003D239F19
MPVIALAILTFAHVLPWLVNRSATPTDPVKICFALSAITTIPYLTLIAFGYKSDVLIRFDEHHLNELLVVFSMLYSAGLVALWFGVAIGLKLKLGRAIKLSKQKTSPLGTTFVISMLLALYLFGLLDKIGSSGGVEFILSNLNRRVSIIERSSPISWLMEPSAFLLCFVLLYSHGNSKFPGRIVTSLLIFFIFISLAFFGGRKLPIFVLIFSMMAYYIYVKKFNFYSVWTVSIGSILVLFFVGMLHYRGSTDLSLLSPALTAANSVRNLSYIDTYIFIQDYFSRHGHWHGLTFRDLFVRTGITHDGSINVPIDDGVYIRTLFQGWHVMPPTDVSAMYPSSWPPETYGNGYLNFGAVGALAFFLIRGIIVGVCFAICRASKYAPTFYFIALFAAFNFHMTNLRIVQFLLILIPVLTFHYFIQGALRIRAAP